MFDKEALVKRLVEAIGSCVIDLPPDVTRRLEESYVAERDETARTQLRALLDNIEIAKRERVPLCQDTGMVSFFVEAGYNFPFLSDLHRAIPVALERATREVPLRPNTVHPLSGKNTRDNLGWGMPPISIDLVEGDGAVIHILPKGGGSENMSALWPLTPHEGIDGLKRRVLEQVQYAGGKPCPPIVLGIGIGGGVDTAARLAKRALLRPLDSPNPDAELAALEKELLADVNRLGIGPMGLGGATTALAAHIECASRHPVTFPVALVIQCWCDRRTSVRVSRDGKVS